MSDLKNFIVTGESKIKIRDYMTKPKDGISKEKIIKKTNLNLEKMESFIVF